MKLFSVIKKFSPLFFLALFSLASPAFAFTNLEGQADSIQNHIGKNKWTIIEIWVSDCHSCRQHIPEMVKFDGKLKNVRLLGISLDGQEGLNKAKSFISEFDVKFPTLISNPIEVNAWMIENIEESLIGTPTFILFNEKGKLIAAQPGIVSVKSLESFILKNTE